MGVVGARGRLTLTAAAIMTLAVGVPAGQQIYSRFRPVEPPITNAVYDGRFTFARLKYVTSPGGYGYCGLPAWAHGYLSCRGGRRAETSLMNILKEISYLNPHVEDSVVLALDDPQLPKYPVAYMTEATSWTLTDKEA